MRSWLGQRPGWVTRGPWIGPAAILLAIAAVGTGVAAAAAGTAVGSERVKLGRVLVNSSGRALYVSTRDPNGHTTCTGSCAQRWQPLLGTSAVARSGSGLNQRLLGVIKRPAGGTQVTYDHHPLYTFVGDKSAKTTSGEGATEFGGRWYLISTTGQDVKPSSSGPCNPVCSGY
jgi:predicted lipoprotein with Yx(FWY)xxD motif